MLHHHRYWMRAGLLLAAVLLIGAFGSSNTVTQAQGGGTISYGAKVFGTISADAPHLAYSFSGATGDIVTAIVDNWTGTLDVYAELIAPSGVLVTESTQDTLDDNLQGAYISAVLPEDGVYLLRISGENGSTGDFALTLLGRGAPDSVELIFGQAVDVTLTPGAEPQLFWFEAEDCPTTLTVTNLSEGQPFTYPFVIRVTDQRGQTVALLRGGEQLEDWVTVTPRSGRYEVEVSSDHPLQAGNVRLLVTCAADAPGCVTGQAGISGAAGTGPQTCTPCFTPGTPPESGNCPDLHFTAGQISADPLRVTVKWDEMTGATGYAVYVYGRVADGGDVYLTHAVWTPGDPTAFTWVLPEGYVGFRFVLRVYVGDDLVCTAETSLEVEGPPEERLPVCLAFDIDVDIISREEREVAWTWSAYPGAEAYVLEWFEVLDDGSEALRGSVLLSSSTTSFSARLPAPTGARDNWRVRVRVQLDGGFPCFAEHTFGFLHHEPDCESFVATITDVTGGTVTVEWTDYPGAEGYSVAVVDSFGAPVAGASALVPPAQHSLIIGLGPGGYVVTVGPWFDPEGMICPYELKVEIQEEGQQVPCIVRTNRADVRVRVGPGLDRAAFAFLTAGVEYPVIGYAYDAAGNLWWQIDRASVPGGEMALSLWVLGSDVEALGNCDQVPPGEVPVPEPGQPGQPGQPGGPGQWLPCGSCDTCGHPANECVTSPEGQCLWDPATCVQQPEQPGEPGEPGGQCYHITAAVDMSGCQYSSGSAMIDTPPNCDGGYSPGTTIAAHAVAVDPKCNVNYWSGCGASGSENSITFTATSSCTITAHMYYGN